MHENRMHSFLKSVQPPQLDGAAFSLATPVPPPALPPMMSANPAAIYQAAFEKAKQDYELNKLFNPEYYEEGGGI